MDELLKAIAGGGAMAALFGLYLWIHNESQKIDKAERHSDMQQVFERLRAMEAAIDRANHGNMLRLISSKAVIPDIKDSAAEVLKSIEIAEKERQVT